MELQLQAAVEIDAQRALYRFARQVHYENLVPFAATP